MAFVRVADVEIPVVLDGVGIAEVGAFTGDAGAFGEDGAPDDENFAKDGFARLADSDGQW